VRILFEVVKIIDVADRVVVTQSTPMITSSE